MSRRYEKAIDTWDGSQWVATSTNHFVYDGWNLVREVGRDSLGAPVTNQYVWGTDLSGTLGGAGGVGGLLSMTRSDSSGTSNYCYCADGNGNINDMVDANGTLVAHYEYSAFGETLVATGSMAAINPWRFSTRYYGTETGLIMFPRRPYSPPLGRFLCEDPLEELGNRVSSMSIDSLRLDELRQDVALYVFCGNQPVSRFDPTGEAWHYEREKKPRATVWFDAPDDTVADLAKIVQLDASEVNRWLKDASGNRVSTPKICEKYTVPNVALVAVATSRSTLDPTGLLTRPYFIIHSDATLTAFQSRDFDTVFLDAAYGGLSSSELMSHANDDLWGMVLFGHGKAGDLVMQVGFFPWIIYDYIGAGNMNSGHKLGAGIVYFLSCGSRQLGGSCIVKREIQRNTRSRVRTCRSTSFNTRTLGIMGRTHRLDDSFRKVIRCRLHFQDGWRCSISSE